MTRSPDLTGVTYDSGALIAAERRDPSVWALHQEALEQGLFLTVPAGVLAQAWRGGPQAQLSRFLASCRIESLDEERARAAGTACKIAGTSDIVDASIIVGAAARGDLVATSDQADLTHLRDALQAKVRIEPI